MAFQKQSHCKRGHLLDGKNLYFFKSGEKIKRKCVECINISENSVTTKLCKTRWAQANKERAAETARQWRTRNLERARETGRRSEKKRRTEKHDEWIAARRKWAAANREKCALYSRKVLCKKHGITLEIYDELLARQSGVCAICHQAESERKGRLSIDHDHACCPGTHSCGRCIRGLLCTKCNQALGCLEENRAVIKRALTYLDSPKQAFIDSIEIGDEGPASD